MGTGWVKIASPEELGHIETFVQEYRSWRNSDFKFISNHYQETYKGHFGIKMSEIYCKTEIL